MVYCWTHRYPEFIVLHETRLSKPTVVDFYNFCREVCVVVLEQHSEAIGGLGRYVEIDESKFGKRKYHRGKRVEGVWVFGGIERDSNPPKCFFTTVTDRSAATNHKTVGITGDHDIIRLLESVLFPGGRRSVNHSVGFVSATNSACHTNHIDSRWNALKKSLPRFGTRKELYDSYFAEHCVRKKFIDNATDKFREVLCLINLVYHPPTLAASPVIEGELLVDAEEAASNAASDSWLSTTRVHTATFDLQFEVSHCDESGEMDTSSDLFL